MFLALLACFLAHPPCCSYDTARESSLATNTPLVIYVSCPPLCVPGTIEHYEKCGFTWQRAPGILIGIPRRSPGKYLADWVEWTDTLSPTASVADISSAILRRQQETQKAAPVPALFTQDTEQLLLKVRIRARFGRREWK